MSDSLLNYLAKPFTDGLLPFASGIPFFLAWGYAKHRGRWSELLPPQKDQLYLSCGLLAFVVGSLLYGESHEQIPAVFLAGCAFLLGYSWARTCRRSDLIARLFLAVSVAYVTVCLLALFGIAPSLFTLEAKLWIFRGVARYRPEITTDQNMQVFYLFLAPVVLVLPYRPLRFWLAIALTCASSFILLKLQTRSGVLVLLGLCVLACLAPLRQPALGRWKTVLLPLLASLSAAMFYAAIVTAADGLIARMEEARHFRHTGAEGRIAAITYIIERILIPTWWIPQGLEVFRREYGGLPHSNVTAVFLEGGIVGLFTWFGYVALPVVRLGWRFLLRRIEPVGTMVLLAAIGMLVIQLSLCIPFFKQVWFWGGATCGILESYRFAESGMRFQRDRLRIV